MSEKVNVGDQFHRASDRMNVRVMAVAEGYAMVIKVESPKPPPGQVQGIGGYPFVIEESVLLKPDYVWAPLK